MPRRTGCLHRQGNDNRGAEAERFDAEMKTPERPEKGIGAFHLIRYDPEKNTNKHP